MRFWKIKADRLEDVIKASAKINRSYLLEFEKC